MKMKIFLYGLHFREPISQQETWHMSVSVTSLCIGNRLAQVQDLQNHYKQKPFLSDDWCVLNGIPTHSGNQADLSSFWTEQEGDLGGPEANGIWRAWRHTGGEHKMRGGDTPLLRGNPGNLPEKRLTFGWFGGLWWILVRLSWLYQALCAHLTICYSGQTSKLTKQLPEAKGLW